MGMTFDLVIYLRGLSCDYMSFVEKYGHN